jgi:hypothetical protein
MASCHDWSCFKRDRSATDSRLASAALIVFLSPMPPSVDHYSDQRDAWYHLGKQSEPFHHAGEHVDACDVHEADINGA